MYYIIINYLYLLFKYNLYSFTFAVCAQVLRHNIIRMY